MTAIPKDEKAFWEANFWEALETRDAHMDGVFFYAVLSTGVYCRPSCPSRRPRRENVIFFQKRDAAERAGFRACRRCKPEREHMRDAQSELVEKICRYLESHLEEAVTLAGLSRQLGLSPFHLQRTFKEATGITPRAYAEFCRMESFKGGLREGRSVTTALYDAGYGSSSRVYERAASHLGMTPRTYKRGGAGETIRYDVVATPVGRLLVGATQKGICAVQFGDSEAELDEIPAQRISGGRSAIRPRVSGAVDQRAVRASERTAAKARPAAGHTGHRVPAARMGISAVDPLRRHAFVWRDRQGVAATARVAGQWRGLALPIRSP